MKVSKKGIKNRTEKNLRAENMHVLYVHEYKT